MIHEHTGMVNPDVIEHYGVKGMRWGVRKRSKAEEKERAKRFKAVNKRRRLSDEELKQRIERLQNEKKLKELTDQDLQPGRTIAKKIMSESGQKVAKRVLTGAALYGIKVAITRKFSPAEAVSYFT